MVFHFHPVTIHNTPFQLVLVNSFTVYDSYPNQPFILCCVVFFFLQAARNMHQKDVEDVVLHDAAVSKTIEHLHESGEEAIWLDTKTFQYAVKENDLLFVDFFASWQVFSRYMFHSFFLGRGSILTYFLT